MLIVSFLSAGVVSVAAGVYCLHYEHIVKEYGACPIPMLVREAETGNVGTCTCELGIYTSTLITGKSTAQGFFSVVRVLFMKTKRTSHAVIIERCCKFNTSTLSR